MYVGMWDKIFSNFYDQNHVWSAAVFSSIPLCYAMPFCHSTTVALPIRWENTVRSTKTLRHSRHDFVHKISKIFPPTCLGSSEMFWKKRTHKENMIFSIIAQNPHHVTTTHSVTHTCRTTSYSNSVGRSIYRCKIVIEIDWWCTSRESQIHHRQTNFDLKIF